MNNGDFAPGLAHLICTTALNSSLSSHVPDPVPTESVGELLKKGRVTKDEALAMLLAKEIRALERAKEKAEVIDANTRQGEDQKE